MYTNKGNLHIKFEVIQRGIIAGNKHRCWLQIEETDFYIFEEIVAMSNLL